jgi:hypothetical protein
MTTQFWKIEESVGAGCYIVLPGIFSTREGAEREIATYRHSPDMPMRAVLYQTGWNEAERVEA